MDTPGSRVSVAFRLQNFPNDTYSRGVFDILPLQGISIRLFNFLALHIHKVFVTERNIARVIRSLILARDFAPMVTLALIGSEEGKVDEPLGRDSTFATLSDS